MTSGYEILEHTADTGFRARGESLEDLFAQAAHALIAVALDPADAIAFEPREILASGAGLQELLVNWLNEVLYLIDAGQFVPARFEAIRVEGDTVAARLLGEARDGLRHPPRMVVKAATFHQLSIHEHNGGWEAEVYLDI
jgi:SHS2 domain-containing protein